MPRWLVPPLAVAAALVFCASASAHASLSPPVVTAGTTQMFTLAVPTEKEGATTTQIELTAPDEVKSEWASLQTLFEKFATDTPDLSGVTPEMTQFEEAAKRIEAHAKATCGIDLGT